MVRKRVTRNKRWIRAGYSLKEAVVNKRDNDMYITYKKNVTIGNTTGYSLGEKKRANPGKNAWYNR